MENPLKRILKFGRKSPVSESPEKSQLDGIDAETLDIARQLAYEKRLKRDASKKWHRGSKADSDISDDELTEALKGMQPNAASIMKKVFARTVEDTILANRFQDTEGKTVAHLSLKKAVAMDGLRDLDDDISVSYRAASPMNPEGRFNVPTSCASDHQFAERFNEAMNPVRNGNRINGVIPELILDHFANFAAFIGYPACEMIACHPTVSNACTIPGEDAIAPGYSLSFIDSEDMNDNGIPDELELVETGGVRRALGRIGAMEALKDAIGTLASSEGVVGPTKDNGASLDALALALERLAAYEDWERQLGAGENAALAVNEGFIQPLSERFNDFVAKQDDKSRRDAIAALSLALADLAKKEHPVLDEVRSTRKRRDTVEAVGVAVATFTVPDDEWDSVRALNDLAVAVERVGAYENLSDRNAEAMAALNMALIDYSTRQNAEAKHNVVDALGKVKSAMDADDFDFVDPNAVQQPQVPQPQGQQMVDPQAMLAQQREAQHQAELQARQEQQAQEHAEQLERERQEDRQAKVERTARNAEAREGRINELHRQKMGFLEQQALAKQQAAQALAEAKGKSIDANEARAAETHKQKMDIAQRMADQKLQQQQAQFEAQQQQAQLQQQQMAMAQQQQEAQQRAAEEEKQKQEEKRTETRIAAEVAKERQKYLDRWKQRADDMGMNEICTKLARNARVFGIGIAIPVVDGIDYEEPMDYDKIREGSYRGFTVVEPTWIYPEVESDDLINPMSPSFFEPMYWAATGSSGIGTLAIHRIHKSWMVIVRNKELPNMLRPMYYYGGIPLTQEIYEAVFCADKLMNEVPKLAMTKRSVIVKGDPNDLITNPEGVIERLQAMSQVQDNFGFKFVGRNADVMQLETSLSEFDQVIAKANQRIASIAKMPETKLFKTQLAGMNSAGRYEWDDYSQLLINIQNNWFKPLLSLHYRLDTKSRTGKVIDLKVNFNPIDVPTQSEKGEAESRTVQTINAAVQAGWLAPAEARTIARSREDSMFSSISAEMPEELEQAQQQQQQGGGMPGMPGGGEGGDPAAAMMGGDMPQMPASGGEAGSPLDAPDAPKGPQEPQAKK